MRVQSIFAGIAAAAALFSSGAAFANGVGAATTYDISHSMGTNVAGVTTFPDAPQGFNAINATPEARAIYGFPPAPDASVDAHGYQQWSRAMTAAASAKRYSGPLRVTSLHSMPMQAAPSAGNNSVTPAGVNRYASYNWSGVVNTTNVTSFDVNASFQTVLSEFTVPSAQDAFASCDGTQHFEVSWNGIDGFSDGDVLQGGTESGAKCVNGVTTTQYCAWIEWYPTYPVLCQYAVDPGDDMFVETYATGPTTGYVFVYDYTKQIFGSYALNATTPPFLVGNSAEYIVERPCCVGNNSYPLTNYVWNLWAANFAYTGDGTFFYPGMHDANTYYLHMLDDGGTQTISHPAEIEGRFGMVMKDVNCAYAGGCAP